MGATASDLAKGIAPGSTEYGDRQVLEDGLGDAIIDQPTGAPNPAAGAPPLPVDSTGDPMAALLSGQLNPNAGQDPLTSGLSVGLGAGTPGSIEQQDPVKTRLQQVAQFAKSPLVRAAARNELRRITREAI